MLAKRLLVLAAADKGFLHDSGVEIGGMHVDRFENERVWWCVLLICFQEMERLL